MIHRVIVAFKSGEVDAIGDVRKEDIEKFLQLKVEFVKTRRVFTIKAELTKDEFNLLIKDLFVDPITEYISNETGDFDWLIEIGYKPGVTDNVGSTTKTTAIPDIIGRQLREDEGVYTSTQYLISGKSLSRDNIETIGNKLLANPIVESINIASYEEFQNNGISYELPIIHGTHKVTVHEFDLNISDEQLIGMSREGILALRLDEMKTIRDYYQRPDVIAERKRIGMEERFWDKPTDVELESIAQTWSEHCKHKIFNASIQYHNEDNNSVETIDSLFNTYIKRPSNEISNKLGWVASSFHDNAGAVRFNDRILVVDKIETHNSPSALDPYGGAITGIVGVNRDPMGTGIGAKLMFNVFGYCFGDPNYKKELSEGILHPRRIRDGVHKGVIDGGNQSGIPLVSGWEFFDERFIYRPLVFCGTIGIMPIELQGELTSIKHTNPDDVIFMCGGRIGKDGIHGATFSSAELDKQSPVQAVQIGDPITQKKMSDFLLEARDLGLYQCITDNGAGGLSSSIGEMARIPNGCKFDLKQAPLKYQGLDPWEILISEAQERMTVSVNKMKVDQFVDLAKKRDVEVTALGHFDNSGKFHITYGDKTVAYLDLEFLHDGVPKMELLAKWRTPLIEEPVFDPPESLDQTLMDMLSRLNICSKEDKLRQYDHEVKGLSVIKLLVGKQRDVPTDATIVFLEYGVMEGLAVAVGVNPHYSDIDTYHMTASVIDEAIRKIIAIGGKLPSKETVFYALDNFCWNISSLDSVDGQYKLAQLVRANKALADYCQAFDVPLISGKDSMKNVWKFRDSIAGEEAEHIISIPPTLMFSARAKIEDIRKVVTMDVKCPGDYVYIVGETYNELGGSEYYSYMGEKIKGERFIGNTVPKVNVDIAKKIYSCVSDATHQELCHSIHSPTLGGLGVAIAQVAFAGGYGLDIDLSKIPSSGLKRDDFILFSQSNSRFIVTIPPIKKEPFEQIMEGCIYAKIGIVTDEMKLKVKGLQGEYIIDSNLDQLKHIWKKL